MHAAINCVVPTLSCQLNMCAYIPIYIDEFKCTIKRLYIYNHIYIYNQNCCTIKRGLLHTFPGIPTDASRRRAQSYVTVHTTAACCGPYPLRPRTPTAGPGVFTLRMVLPPTLPTSFHTLLPPTHSHTIPHRQRGRLVLLHSCSAHLSTIVVVV